MDEYVATGANYFVCSFQWGGLTHNQAMHSIDLFVEEIMTHYRLAASLWPPLPEEERHDA
jgi:hypothetical protein